MARPQEAGLEYFGLPTDLFEIDELHFVIAKHGLAGRGVISSLLMRLFEVGYCFRWGVRDRTIFASKIGAPLELVEVIVSDAISEGFFDTKLYETQEILSSKWIQELYESATVKRKSVKWKREFLLITPKNDNALVSDALESVNADIEENKLGLIPEETPQSRGEESKGNKSKGNSNTHPKDKNKFLGYVFLTSSEIEKFKTDLGEDVFNRCIVKLDSWIASDPTIKRKRNGQNAGATFTSWVINAVAEEQQRAQRSKPTVATFNQPPRQTNAEKSIQAAQNIINRMEGYGN